MNMGMGTAFSLGARLGASGDLPGYASRMMRVNTHYHSSLMRLFIPAPKLLYPHAPVTTTERTVTMHYRPLGRSGLNVSLIGLGTMTWGNQNTQDEGFEPMDYALERGINFFDTAEMYAIPPAKERFGTTETIIGNWFAARGTRD